jgi:hypothetical protein
VKDEKENETNEIVQSTLRLPKKLLIDFKMQSIKERRSMSRIMIELIKEYLTKKGGR